MKHFKFKVSLVGAPRPTWRRLLIPALYSFGHLHEAVQDACGWEDCHLYTFFESVRPLRRLPGVDMAGDDYDWESHSLTAWFGAGGHKRCVYVYDFGDDWRHSIVLEAIEDHPIETGRRLLAGKGMFPPEDCGGIWGFERCLELKDPARPEGAPVSMEDREFLDWLGDWSPDGFDLAEAQVRFEVAGRSTLGGDEPPVAQRPASAPRPGGPGQVEQVIRAGSLLPAGRGSVTALPCKRRPKRKACQGTLAVEHSAEGTEIRWRCVACGDTGTVQSWRGGPGDLPGLVGDKDLEGEAIRVLLEPKEYAVLLDPECFAIESDRLLYSATPADDGVLLTGSPGEVEDLCEEVAEELHSQESPTRRRRLSRVMNSLDVALESDLEYVGRDEAEQLVTEVTRGLRLTEEEQDALVATCQGVLGVLGLAEPQLVGRVRGEIRATAEALVLHRQLHEALAVRSVDFKHLQIFLGALEQLETRFADLASRGPAQALGLYTAFLGEIAIVAPRIHTAENELEEFTAGLARAAMTVAQLATIRRPRPLMEDLLTYWGADTVCCFTFVPQMLADLKLGARDARWLEAEVESRLQELTEGGDAEGWMIEDLERLLRTRRT